MFVQTRTNTAKIFLPIQTNGIKMENLTQTNDNKMHIPIQNNNLGNKIKMQILIQTNDIKCRSKYKSILFKILRFVFIFWHKLSLSFWDTVYLSINVFEENLFQLCTGIYFVVCKYYLSYLVDSTTSTRWVHRNPSKWPGSYTRRHSKVS